MHEHAFSLLSHQIWAPSRPRSMTMKAEGREVSTVNVSEERHRSTHRVLQYHHPRPFVNLDATLNTSRRMGCFNEITCHGLREMLSEVLGTTVSSMQDTDR